MWTAGFIQVQLEEDGGGSTRQRWMETSSLWPMLHWEWQGLSQVSKPSLSVTGTCCCPHYLKHARLHSVTLGASQLTATTSHYGTSVSLIAHPLIAYKTGWFSVSTTTSCAVIDRLTFDLTATSSTAPVGDVTSAIPVAAAFVFLCVHRAARLESVD